MIALTTTGNIDEPSGGQSKVLLAGAVGTLLACAGLLVYGSGRGYDLTDETFYLIWARDPEAYQLTYQPFGYLLHPLFTLVAGNLQAYRLSGFAAAAAAGALLGGSLPLARGKRLLFGTYGAGSALTIYFPWIITPSYNSAANVGAMLILGGMFNILSNTKEGQITGCCASGAGLCTAAFAKPPLFAIAACGIIIASLVSRQSRATLLCSLALAIALVCGFLAPLSVVELVRRMAVTQHLLALPNTPSGLPLKIMRDWFAVPLPLVVATVALALGFAMWRRKVSRWFAYAALAISLCYLGSLLPDELDGEIPDFLGLTILLIASGYAALHHAELRKDLRVIALLMIAPLTVGIGTFNNEWFQLNFSMVFAFMTLFAISSLDPLRWRRTIALIGALIGPPAVMILAAYAPYSLPGSIFEQNIAVVPLLANGTILVDQETASFINSAHGLGRGALVIDLSGAGPGVAAAVGGRSPVLPWLNPATPTWPNVVWSRLSPAQQASAWFIDPIWPKFRSSKPAEWLLKHERNYCTMSLSEMPFWGEERTLRLRRPCS